MNIAVEWDVKPQTKQTKQRSAHHFDGPDLIQTVCTGYQQMTIADNERVKTFVEHVAFGLSILL